MAHGTELAGPERESRDPWYFQRWAGEQRVGNPTRKLILMRLAVMAETNTGYCFASQADLAEVAECSERSVRTHLTGLVESGLVLRRHNYRDGTRLADSFLLLGGGVNQWPDGLPAEIAATGVPAIEGGPTGNSSFRPTTLDNDRITENGDVRSTEGTTSPCKEPVTQEIPPDFPENLRPHARAVLSVLRSVAANCGAAEPKAASLAHTIMARPRRPLVMAAHDWAAWVSAQPSRRWPRDVIASYRNWLDRLGDLAATEVLPGEGPAADMTNVAPLREPRTAEERRAVRQRRRMAIARGELPASEQVPAHMRLGGDGG